MRQGSPMKHDFREIVVSRIPGPGLLRLPADQPGLCWIGSTPGANMFAMPLQDSSRIRCLNAPKLI